MEQKLGFKPCLIDVRRISEPFRTMSPNGIKKLETPRRLQEVSP